MMARSACGVNVSVSVAELLAALDSVTPAGATTAAVLTNVPVALAETVPVTVKVAVPPLARLTAVAMLPVPLAAAQLEPPEATHVHVAPVIAGASVSITDAPVTLLGPLLVTTMV